MSNDATTQDQYQYFHYFTVSSFLKQIILFMFLFEIMMLEMQITFFQLFKDKTTMQ